MPSKRLLFPANCGRLPSTIGGKKRLWGRLHLPHSPLRKSNEITNVHSGKERKNPLLLRRSTWSCIL